MQPIGLGTVAPTSKLESIRAFILETLAGLRGGRPAHEEVNETFELTIDNLELFIPRGGLVGLTGRGQDITRAINQAWEAAGLNVTSVPAIVEIGEPNALALQEILRLESEEFAIIDPVRMAAQPYRRQRRTALGDIGQSDRLGPVGRIMQHATARGEESLGKERTMSHALDALFALSREDASGYLTKVCSAVGGQNGITSYFMFKGGELFAADLGAYRADSANTLRNGFDVVETAAVQNAADSIVTLAPQISRRNGPFGEFRAANLGFGHSVIVVNSSSPGTHLIGLTHPKENYRYGSARKTRDRLLELVANGGTAPKFGSDEIARFRAFDPFSSSHKATDEPAMRNLPELAVGDLSGLLNRSYFCDPRVSGLSGFIYIEDDGKARRITAASSSLTDETRSRPDKIWLKGDYGPLASPIFLDDTLNTLVEAHDNFGRDTEMLRLTGSLRTFWFSFERAVVGIRPFRSGKARGKSVQYFLVAACHAGSAGEPSFNYGLARQAIQRLCDEAESLL
jgi:hypothetical protein